MLEASAKTAENRGEDSLSAVTPQLIAVSKRHPSAAIVACHSLGQRHFGENYLNEALDKIDSLTDLQDPPIWHFIGSIQSNKCRAIAEAFDWVQTVDRLKLVAKLNAGAGDAKRTVDCLIQVNIDEDSAKSGVSPENIEDLARAIHAASNLRLRGLMTITARSEPSERRASFARMRSLFDALKADYENAGGWEASTPTASTSLIDTLSMGMSDDMDLAIAEGSTMIRVGTALFGERS